MSRQSTTRYLLLSLFVLFFFFGFLFVGPVYGEEATFSWQANTEETLAGYRIYYGTASGVYSNTVEVPKTVTTYTVSGLAPATTYYFAAKAYDTSGLESDFSNEVTLTTQSTTGLAATFSWQANTEPSLAGYRIYYGTASGSYSTTIEVPKTVTTWTVSGLAAETTYYFAAKAYDTSGAESNFSDEVIWPDPAGSQEVPLNNPPVASASTVQTSEDKAVTGTLSATDPDNDSLVYSLVENGSLGAAVLTNAQAGSFTYTPHSNKSGTDSFTFKANDGKTDSAVAAVTVTVSSVNDVPVAHSTTGVTGEDTVLTGMLSGSDIENSPLTFSLVSNASYGSVTVQSTGAYSYTPNQNFNGSDSFTFKVSDGAANSTPASVAVTVTAANDPPVVVNLSISTDKNMVVTGNLSATDAENDSLVYSLVSNGLLGTAVITDSSTGAFSYTPIDQKSGLDSFTFKASDGTGESNIGSVEVEIKAVNEPPVAVILTQDFADSPLMREFDGTSSYDPDGEIESYLWNFGDGTTAIDPVANHVYSIPGEYSVPLSVKDDGGASAQDIVTIIVTETDNEDPVADFTSSAFVEDLSTFKFSGFTSTDSDGEIVDYSWNFGDGETGSGETVFHQFLNPGMYSVTLTVTDNDGGTSKKVGEVDVITVESEMLHLEVGKVPISADWQQVVFEAPFDAPVVIANPASYTDSDPGVIRIHDVQPSGFSIRFQNWDYLGFDHSAETVGYIVMESGNYALSDGSRVEAGRFATALTEDFIQIHFEHPFETDPIVLTSIVSTDGGEAVVGRVRNITATGFEYKMQEQEINSPSHVVEGVNYLAWEPSSGTISDVLTYEVGRTENVITHDWSEIVFDQFFTAPPVFLADMQTSNGMDTSNLRYQALLTDSVQIKVTEEESLDLELSHAAEEIGLIVLENLAADACTSADYFAIDPQVTAQPSPDVDRVILFDATGSSCYEMVNCVKEDRECSFEWDYGGEGRVVGGNLSNIIHYEYKDAGEYTALLTITEQSSLEKAVKEIAVTASDVVTPLPQADFSSVVTGKVVTLTASVLADAKEILIFWGDRKRSKFVPPFPAAYEHSYRKGGAYDIRVKVTDGQGNTYDYLPVYDEDLAILVP